MSRWRSRTLRGLSRVCLLMKSSCCRSPPSRKPKWCSDHYKRFQSGGGGMTSSWKVVEAKGQRIQLERGVERKELQRPSHPAARTMFMLIRPGEQINDDMIHFFLTVDQPR